MLSSADCKTAEGFYRWQIGGLANTIQNRIENQAEFAGSIFKQFEVFRSKYGKTYASVTEQLLRFDIFKTNLKIIDKLNSESDGSVKFGVNLFSDLTFDEFKAQYSSSTMFTEEEVQNIMLEDSLTQRARKNGPGPQKRDRNGNPIGPTSSLGVGLTPADNPDQNKRLKPTINPTVSINPAPLNGPPPTVSPAAFFTPDSAVKPSLAVRPGLATTPNPMPAVRPGFALVPNRKPAVIHGLATWPNNQPAVVHGLAAWPKRKPAVVHGLAVRPNPQPAVVANPTINTQPASGSKPIGINQYKQNMGSIQGPIKNDPTIPRVFDWRQNNPNYPPCDNQLQGCGACYAFAAAGALEVARSKLSGELFKYSKQQMIDCSGTNKCAGGHPLIALRYMRDVGLLPEYECPYLARNDTCKNGISEKYRIKKIVKGLGFENIVRLLPHTPLVASLNHATEEMQHYKGGVLNPKNCKFDLKDPNQERHSVVMIGYGYGITAENKQVWFFSGRNSWGPQWGENGNFRMNAFQCGFGIENFGILLPGVTYPKQMDN